jgi:hypothetical protein
MEQKASINQLMCFTKAIRSRIGDLQSLRQSAQTRTTHYSHDGSSRTDEATYDIKAVDKKITELETFLFMADSAIKQSNATTIISLDFDMKEMLAPLS